MAFSWNHSCLLSLFIPPKLIYFSGQCGFSSISFDICFSVLGKQNTYGRHTRTPQFAFQFCPWGSILEGWSAETWLWLKAGVYSTQRCLHSHCPQNPGRKGKRRNSGYLETTRVTCNDCLCAHPTFTFSPVCEKCHFKIRWTVLPLHPRKWLLPAFLCIKRNF